MMLRPALLVNFRQPELTMKSGTGSQFIIIFQEQFAPLSGTSHVDSERRSVKAFAGGFQAVKIALTAPVPRRCV